MGRYGDAEDDGSDAASGYGIEIVRVGIQRIKLPTTTTDRVFDRMKEERMRMAQKARSQGKAEADAIRSRAQSASSRILAFAERTAQAIMAKGDEEAAAAYEPFAKDPELAIFLRKIEMLKTTLPYNTTFLLDTRSMPELQLFDSEPGSTDGVKSE